MMISNYIVSDTEYKEGVRNKLISLLPPDAKTVIVWKDNYFFPEIESITIRYHGGVVQYRNDCFFMNPKNNGFRAAIIATINEIETTFRLMQKYNIIKNIVTIRNEIKLSLLGRMEHNPVLDEIFGVKICLPFGGDFHDMPLTQINDMTYQEIEDTALLFEEYAVFSQLIQGIDKTGRKIYEQLRNRC